jgi:hypothetical protein
MVAVVGRGRLIALLAVSLAAAGSALAAGGPLPLSARVIQPGEFKPFTPAGAHLYTDANEWVGSDATLSSGARAAEVAELKRNGFKAIYVQQLGVTSPQQAGLSYAVQLGSPAQAKAELAAGLRDQRQESKSFEAFPVAGIPGAAGFHLAGNSSFEGDNITFADGPYVYLVGQGWGVNIRPAAPRAALVAAAQRLYRRVHGH